MLTVLLVPLALATLVYLYALIRAAARRHMLAPHPEAVLLGAMTNFFDTLGIGSFAPTIGLVQVPRAGARPADPAHHAPGPCACRRWRSAAIFLVLLGVLVDPVLLFGCVIAFLVGALIGAPLVARAKVWLVQLVVAIALLAAATFYALSNLDLMPGGGTASALPPALTIVAIAMNFLFGILINFGVGHYAPTLALFSLMGMDPQALLPDHGDRRRARRAGRDAAAYRDRRDRPQDRASASRSAACRRCSSRRSWSARCRSSCCAGSWSWSCSTPPAVMLRAAGWGAGAPPGLRRCDEAAQPASRSQ